MATRQEVEQFLLQFKMKLEVSYDISAQDKGAEQ